MAVGVRRHLDRGVTEPRLHQLERQLEPAVDAPVDAPRGIEVAQAVQALVFGAAVLVDDTGRDLRRMEAALDDRVAVLDAAAAVGEDEVRARSLDRRGGARARRR